MTNDILNAISAICGWEIAGWLINEYQQRQRSRHGRTRLIGAR